MSTLEQQRQGVGPGWQPLIDRLDAQLRELVGEYGVSQIKEKFGTLRFYAFDLPAEAYDLICAAEDESGRICEECGEPGENSPIGSWWKTLCGTCRAAALRRKARGE